MSIAVNIIVTPPSLLGMDRRMAYAHKKYHSGLMWVGVTRGLAGIKFSGSVSIFGKNILMLINTVTRIVNPIRSLAV